MHRRALHIIAALLVARHEMGADAVSAAAGEAFEVEVADIVLDLKPVKTVARIATRIIRAAV